MKVLALAGYDSFLNTARLIAPYFEAQGAEVEFALVKARKKKQIAPEQIAEMGISSPIQYVDVRQLCQSGEILKYDIILSCLEGLSTRRLFHYLAEYGDKRPYVICVYPGLVLRYAYDGFSMRAPADQLWLNCKRDMEAYTAMCEAFGLDASNARLFGNASLLEKIDRDPEAGAKGPIVFFEQAVIPRYYEERKYLVDQLCELAQRYPERQVLVKARAAGNKATLHRTWHPIEELFESKRKKEGQLPLNIALTEEKASHLLAKAAHCLTISSTVAVEAIYAGVPVSIIRDFGAHEDYGLSYFFGSGLLEAFSEVDLEKKLATDEDWRGKFLEDSNKNISSCVSYAILGVNNRRRRPYTFTAEYSANFYDCAVRHLGHEKILNRDYKKNTLNITSKIKKIFDLTIYMTK